MTARKCGDGASGAEVLPDAMSNKRGVERSGERLESTPVSVQIHDCLAGVRSAAAYLSSRPAVQRRCVLRWLVELETERFEFQSGRRGWTMAWTGRAQLAAAAQWAGNKDTAGAAAVQRGRVGSGGRGAERGE